MPLEEVGDRPTQRRDIGVGRGIQRVGQDGMVAAAGQPERLRQGGVAAEGGGGVGNGGGVGAEGDEAQLQLRQRGVREDVLAKLDVLRARGEAVDLAQGGP